MGRENTKFFLNLEKRNYETKCITKLLDENEQEIGDPDKILEYEESFYKNLYSLKENNLNTEQKDKLAK